MVKVRVLLFIGAKSLIDVNTKLANPLASVSTDSLSISPYLTS